MSQDQSFYDQVMEALGYGDLFGVANASINAVAGDTYAGADSLFDVNDTMIGIISEIIAQINDMLNSGALQSSTQALSALNNLHAAHQGVEALNRYQANVETANEAGGMTGGLSLVANTAGSTGDLLKAASAALAVLGTVLAPEVAGPIIIAAGSLNMLSNTLTAIQNAVGQFNDLIEAIDNALEEAQNNPGGGPVTINPPSDASYGNPGPAGSPGGSPAGGDPIKPVTFTSDDNWQTIQINENQHESFRQSDFMPPDDGKPSPGPGPGGPGPGGPGPGGPGPGGPGPGGPGPGGPGPGGPSPRFPELDELFRNSGDPDPGGPGPGGPGSPPDGDKTKRDPFILDLDGDGIELTQIGAPPVFFDADGDGVAGLTGWVDPDDGFLARDLDGNGLIETQAELFGTSSVDAISDLATQDSNKDGLINADDAIWGQLRLWRDLNQDGESSANELQTMEQAGLLQFSLAGQFSGRVEGDNLIHSTTTYETVNGELGQAAAVFFGLNTLYNQSAPPAVFEPGSPFLDIPDVKGYGTMTDLRYAAFDDPVLFTMVQSLTDDAATISGGEFQSRFEAIALRWAGVENVDPGTDPNDPNLQHEAFLEAFRGAERPDISGFSTRQVSAEDSYFSTLSSLTLRFGVELSTIQLGSASTGAEIDAAYESPFFALSFVSVSPVTGIINGSLERIIYEIAVRLPDDTALAIDKLDKVMPLLAAFRDEYFAEEGDRVDTTFRNEDFNAFVQAALDKYIDNPTVAGFAFAALNSRSSFLGTGGVDTDAIVVDAHQSNFSRTQIIELGQGDDVISVDVEIAAIGAWESDIVFVYRDGDGSDTIDVSAIDIGGNRENHRIFLPDINADQVTVSVLPNAIDVLVEFYNGDTITFIGLHPNGPAGNAGTLEIWTADGVRMDVTGLGSGGLFVSTSADEDFTGTGNLSDSYFYSVGDGADTITEPFSNGDSSTDQLVFGDINRSDLILSTDGNDLVLTFANGQPGDSIRLVNQLAVNGFFSNDPAYKVEKFHFANGEIASAQELVDDYLAAQSTSGDDTITGLRFPDLIQLSDGTDTINGGKSGDTYVRGPAVTGTTTIEDNGASGGDTLIIQGFTRADATFARNGNDVTITLPNGAVILKNQLSTNTGDVIEQIVFSDGPMTATEVTALLFPGNGTFVDVVGTTGAETLNGTAADERIDGLEGDDTLNGRGGSDIYVFGDTSGNDIIDESGSAGSASVDRVQFVNVNPSDVMLVRNGVDLVVEVLATGQTLTIDQQFGSQAQSIEYFEFAGGTIWDAAEIAANSFIRGTIGDDTISGGNSSENFLGLEGNDTLNGGRGDDVYVFRNGDGQDIVNDARFFNDTSVVNTIRLLDTNIADLRIELVNDGGSISDILLRYGNDDTVLINNGFASDEFANIRSIQRVELADGTVLSDQDLIDMAVLYGTDGDDTISGAVRIDGLGGDDVITGFGAQTDFIWREGSGNDTIINRPFDGGGRLVMEGVNRADVGFSRAGLDMVITFIATGETITVRDQFQPVQSGRKAGVDLVVFEDGSFGRNEVANASLAPATAGNDTIVGGWDNEFIRGLEGDDTLDGGQGSDLYVWSKGDGNDVITDGDNGFDDVDVLHLTDVADAGGIRFSRAGGTSYDLQVEIIETGEIITIIDQLRNSPFGLERIQFSDGSFIRLEGIAAFVPVADVAGLDLLEGDFGNNTLEGGVGDDMLNGKEGSDTYVWTRGDGNDTIAETRTEFVGGPGEGGGSEIEVPVESPNDALRLVGVSSDEVSFARPTGSDELIITILDTGETITVLNQFLALLSGIERIVFDDDIFGRADIQAELGGETLTGDGSDQTLAGGLGADLFTLSGGAETVQTGGGRDTIVIGSGGGNDRIEGFNRGVEGTTIELTASPFVDFDALLGAASDTPDGVVIDLGSGNQIVLVGVLVSDLEPENFGFSRPPIVGTDAQDDVQGTLLDDTIVLLGGDDLVQGNGGDDTIDAGDGFDIVYFNGASTDFTVTRNGNEVTVTDNNRNDGDEGSDTIVDAELLSFLGDQVTVSLVNRAPVGATSGNEAELAEDTVLNGAIPAASDPDGDTGLTYALSGAALTGLVLNPNGTFSYTPPVDFNGDVSFDYVVSDPDGATSDPVTFTLTVTPVNDAPLGGDDSGFETGQNETLTIAANTLLANDTDADGDTLSIASVGAAVNGVAEIVGSDIVFTPDAGYVGAASFEYTLSDGSLNSTATVSLDVAGSAYAGFVQGTVGDDRMFGSPQEQNLIYGADGNDLIFGRRLGDHLAGGEGNDRLFGRRGDDILEGGAGNDWLFGSRGKDVVDGGDGRDRLSGGRNDDAIIGGGGNDLLFGNRGDDVLDGGSGRDSLYGGRGNDEFVFSEGYGRDRIEDFNDAGRFRWTGGQDDVIRLDIDGIDSFADLLGVAGSSSHHSVFDFGDGDVLVIRNTSLNELSQEDFIFV